MRWLRRWPAQLQDGDIVWPVVACPAVCTDPCALDIGAPDDPSVCPYCGGPRPHAA